MSADEINAARFLTSTHKNRRVPTARKIRLAIYSHIIPPYFGERVLFSIGHPSSSTEFNKGMGKWVLDKGGEMAKFYNVKRREVFWSDNDLFAPVEDAYFELGEFLATKKLNGHDEKD